MMKLIRFKASAEAFGADLRRWPPDDRSEAEALLQVSPQARTFLAEAREVDALVKAARRAEDAALWPPGEQATALERLRRGVAARIVTPTPGRSHGFSVSSLAQAPRQVFAIHSGWFHLTAGGALAVVIGLMIGSLYVPSAPSDNLLSALQPAPFAIMAD